MLNHFSPIYFDCSSSVGHLREMIHCRKYFKSARFDDVRIIDK
jgi:hypothetical protein